MAAPNSELLEEILNECVAEALVHVAKESPALGILMVLDEKTKTLVTAGANMAVASTFEYLVKHGHLDRTAFQIEEG